MENNLVAQSFNSRYYFKHFRQRDGSVKYQVMEFDLSKPNIVWKSLYYKGKVLRHGRLFDTANQAIKYLRKYLKTKDAHLIYPYDKVDVSYTGRHYFKRLDNVAE